MKKPTDECIHAFELYYALEWDTPGMSNERLGWVAAWEAARKPCLHQIAEPVAVQSMQTETINALRLLHDSVELAIQRGALSARAMEVIIMQPATDVLMRTAPQAAPNICPGAPNICGASSEHLASSSEHLAQAAQAAVPVNLDFDTLREIVDGLHRAWGEAQGFGYCPSSEPYREARKRAISMHAGALRYIESMESFAAPAHPAEGVLAAQADAVRVPLDSLHADAEYLCARLLDKSLTRDEVVAAIRARVDAVKAAPAAVAVPDERAAFEAWAENPRLWSLAHKGAQWAAWQARAALAATPAAVVKEAVEFLRSWPETLPVATAAPVVLPEPDAWRAGAKFALEAVSKVDSLCWLTDSMKEVCIKQAADAVIAERDRLRALLAGSAPAGTVASPAIFGDEDHVLVPRMLLSAACSAIDKKRDGTKTLAELRRYTTGDLSAAAPAADVLDAADREFLAIGRAIQRAAGELPADGEIRIDIENGAGTVYVLESEHCDWRYIDSGDVFSAQINAAIDVAIDAAIAARAAQGGA